MKKELFEELLASVKQAKAIERGELKPARSFHINPTTDRAEGPIDSSLGQRPRNPADKNSIKRQRRDPSVRCGR